MWAWRRRTQAQAKSLKTYCRLPCLAIASCMGFKPKSWRKDCPEIRISLFSNQLLDTCDYIYLQLGTSASSSMAGGHGTDIPSHELWQVMEKTVVSSDFGKKLKRQFVNYTGIFHGKIKSCVCFPNFRIVLWMDAKSSLARNYCIPLF